MQHFERALEQKWDRTPNKHVDLQLKQLGGPLPNRALTDKDTYRIGKQKVQWEKDFPILEKKKENK